MDPRLFPLLRLHELHFARARFHSALFESGINAHHPGFDAIEAVKAVYLFLTPQQPPENNRISDRKKGVLVRFSKGLMAAIDIRNLLKSALEHVREAEKVQDDDPTMAHLQGAVVRTIAELEVAKIDRVSALVPPQSNLTSDSAEHHDDHDANMPAVA